MRRLENKVVFISGAGSGIGRASAHLFSKHGARIAIAELDEVRGATVADAVNAEGGSALFVATDVTQPESVESAVNQCASDFGQIDVLLNCAGGSIAADKPVTEVDLEVWDHTMGLDVKGPFLCCRYAIPHMTAGGGGAIVNFTSVVALKGAFPMHVYTSAKGAIVSFTQALAGRYSRDNIRANAIAPGLILSERILERSGLDPSRPAAEQVEAARGANRHIFDKRHPFSVGTPEDIANVALFLASDESRMVNGAVIPAEGGMAAY